MHISLASDSGQKEGGATNAIVEWALIESLIPREPGLWPSYGDDGQVKASKH